MKFTLKNEGAPQSQHLQICKLDFSSAGETKYWWVMAVHICKWQNEYIIKNTLFYHTYHGRSTYNTNDLESVAQKIYANNLC